MTSMPWSFVYGPDGVGRFLRRARRARGWTQAQFADRMGIDRTTVGSLERTGNVRLATALDAASFLGLDVVLVPRGATVRVEPLATNLSPQNPKDS